MRLFFTLITFFLTFNSYALAEDKFSGDLRRCLDEDANYNKIIEKSNETIKLWERMGTYAKKKGGSPPEFMSTHPSSESRIENFKKWIPEVKNKYSSYQHNYFFIEN